MDKEEQWHRRGTKEAIWEQVEEPSLIKKQNKTKQNKPKQNKTKQNKTKQNKTKQNKTKQNKTKQNKTKQKQNKTKKGGGIPLQPCSCMGRTIQLIPGRLSHDNSSEPVAWRSVVFMVPHATSQVVQKSKFQYLIYLQVTFISIIVLGLISRVSKVKLLSKSFYAPFIIQGSMHNLFVCLFFLFFLFLFIYFFFRDWN